MDGLLIESDQEVTQPELTSSAVPEEEPPRSPSATSSGSSTLFEPEPEEGNSSQMPPKRAGGKKRNSTIKRKSIPSKTSGKKGRKVKRTKTAKKAKKAKKATAKARPRVSRALTAAQVRRLGEGIKLCLEGLPAPRPRNNKKPVSSSSTA